MKEALLKDAPLGKTIPYTGIYQPQLLFPVPRWANRQSLGVSNELPFQGEDIWNAYELSWLNSKGKPMVAHAEISYACSTPNLIESKSLKLYLNSFNKTQFPSQQAVESTLINDLSTCAGGTVVVTLSSYEQAIPTMLSRLPGVHLDNLDISCDAYLPDETLLVTENEDVNEVLCSDLLKSNCPITGQPDWASLGIEYTGKKIHHEGLLRFIVSFRDHTEFHENCVEEIFLAILRRCKPEKLLVQARYTRRGGLDINPYRANYPTVLKNIRLARQ